METEVKEIVLDKLRFGISQSFSNIFLQNLKLDIVDDSLLESRIITALWGFLGKEEHRTLIKYPENWKQAIKERFFPRFFLKRFPVKYHIEEIITYRICPHINVQFDKGSKVHLAFLEGDDM